MNCIVVGCMNKPEKGGSVCRYHKVKMPKNIKHGFYSNYLPKGLMEKLEEIERNDEDLNLIQELNLLRTFAAEQLETLGEDDSPQRLELAVKDARKIKEELAKDEPELQKVAILANNIILNEGYKVEKDGIKQEVRRLLSEIKEMARAEAVLRYSKESSLSLREVNALMALILTLMHKHIQQKETFDAIRYELMGHLDKTTRGRAGSDEPKPIESGTNGFDDSYQRQAVKEVNSE